MQTETIEMEIGVKLLVKGRVQGVGFRWFINQRANSLGLVGCVKNLPDGNVEIEAEGERGRLEELIKYVKTGPSLSKVNDLIVDWCDYRSKYSEFKIVI